MSIIRTDKVLREALRRRAAARGKTISDVVREMLDGALFERQITLQAERVLGALLRPPGGARRRARRARQRDRRS